MGVLIGIKGAVVLGHDAERGHPGRGEAGTKADAVGFDFRQAALEHAGERRGDLWLPGLRSAAPSSQPDAVGQRWRLAEAGEEFVAQQVAFGGGEWRRRQGHGVVLSCGPTHSITA